MRISDWSSDVCSSDLRAGAVVSGAGRRAADVPRTVVARPARGADRLCASRDSCRRAALPALADARIAALAGGAGRRGEWGRQVRARALARPLHPPAHALDGLFVGHVSVLEPVGRYQRSEEHTSELQSLMRT